MGAQPDGAGQPDLKLLFGTNDGAELLAALDESDDGRDFRRQLDEFLFGYGWRHDAVYDLADVPWREDPTIPLATIRAMIDLSRQRRPRGPVPPERRHPRAAVRQAGRRACRRSRDHRKFEELYEAAKHSFPLTEDHAFYIDQLYISVFRRFVLAVGERLVTKGVLDVPDDVFYLYRDELVDALTATATSAPGGRAAVNLSASQLRQRADRARHAAPAARVA